MTIEKIIEELRPHILSVSKEEAETMYYQDLVSELKEK